MGEPFALQLGAIQRKIGDLVTFAVRRDHIALTKAAANVQPVLNALTGTVRAVEYQGTFVKVTLWLNGAADGNAEFVVYLEEGRYFAVPLTIGEPVIATWTIENAQLLAND